MIEKRFTPSETGIITIMLSALLWGAASYGAAIMQGFEELVAIPIVIGIIVMLILGLVAFIAYSLHLWHLRDLTRASTEPFPRIWLPLATLLGIIAGIGIFAFPYSFVEKQWYTIVDPLFIISAIFFLIFSIALCIPKLGLYSKSRGQHKSKKREEYVKYTSHQTGAIATLVAGSMWTLGVYGAGRMVAVPEATLNLLFIPIAWIISFLYIRAPGVPSLKYSYIAGIAVSLYGAVTTIMGSQQWGLVASISTLAKRALIHFTFIFFFIICILCIYFSYYAYKELSR